MKRRRFLERIGGLGAAGTGMIAALGDSAAAETDTVARPPEPKPPTKAILITAAESPLSKALAKGLAMQYRVRLTSRSQFPSEHPLVQSDLGHTPATNALVRGMDAIVHGGEPLPGAGQAEFLDERTRASYNLLRAATEEGVGQVVYLSSLAMMAAYGEDFEVTEDWRPRPAEESGTLAHYLGEYVCREFAREGKLRVVVLRLGRVVDAETVAGKPFDPLWVETRDVVHAVSLALAAACGQRGATLGPWSVFHVGSASPRARFSSAKAAAVLGYKPRFAWDPTKPE